MIPPKYNFYITVGDGEAVQVTPHYKSLSKKYAKENDQLFFRASLVGDISLVGDGYDLINSASIEDKMTLTINKYNNTSGEWEEYYKATFAKTDCKFDRVRKKCTLSGLTTADEYVDILNGYEDTYDLIKLAPATSYLALCKRSAIQIYIAGGNTISAFFNGTYMEEDVDSVVDSHDELTNTYHFSRIKTYNELTVDTTGVARPPIAERISGTYITAGNGFSKGNYRILLEKVASGGDGFSGKYAQNVAYNINTGASEINYIATGGETGSVYFKRDTYILRHYYVGIDTVLGESDIVFYIPDSNNIYFSGFDTISMTFQTSGTIGNKYTLKNILPYYVYQRLLCDVDTVLNNPTYDIASSDFVHSTGNFKKCIGISDNLLGDIVFTDATTSEPTKYGQNDYGQYFTDDFLPDTIGLTNLLPVCRSSWANVSTWFCYTAYYTSVLEPSIRNKYYLNDCYNIADVIKALLKKIAPNITHEATAEYSQFLYSANSIKAVDFRLFIAPKTNVLKSEYDEPVKKAETTMKEIMDMLAKCFQCYWYIDNGKLKIEHIFYFKNNMSYSATQTVSLDLTTLIDQFNGKTVSLFQTEVEYDKSDLNKRYEFGWMDDATEIFDGVTIDVNSNYVQADKTEDITPDNFSSDIDYMLYNPDNFSEDGFALLCATLQGTEYTLPIVSVSLLDEEGRQYGATVQNWYAAWSYLVNMYRYNLPAQSIRVNTLGNMTAIDIIRSMKHSVQFASEKDPDTMEIVKTEIGNGIIDEMSINLDTRIVDMDLIYNPV